MTNVTSVLGQSFVDAKFSLLGQGILIAPATLAIRWSVPMLEADGTLITCDDPADKADSNVALLSAPYVVVQSPAPGTPYLVGLTASQMLGIGYPVPTASGPIPVP